MSIAGIPVGSYHCDEKDVGGCHRQFQGHFVGHQVDSMSVFDVLSIFRENNNDWRPGEATSLIDNATVDVAHLATVDV